MNKFLGVLRTNSNCCHSLKKPQSTNYILLLWETIPGARLFKILNFALDEPLFRINSWHTVNCIWKGGKVILRQLTLRHAIPFSLTYEKEHMTFHRMTQYSKCFSSSHLFSSNFGKNNTQEWKKYILLTFQSNVEINWNDLIL